MLNTQKDESPTVYVNENYIILIKGSLMIIISKYFLDKRNFDTL